MAKTDKLSAVKGMNDILPGESARWEWLEAQVRDLMGRFAYRNIRKKWTIPLTNWTIMSQQLRHKIWR